MQVVTVITDEAQHGYKNFLLPSCKKFNLNLTVLKVREYSTHRMKDIALQKYLKDIPDDEIILFTDGNDTIFLSDETEIMEKYRQLNAPLIFSAEINCWPPSAFKDNYPVETVTRFKYLNSGGFIGVAGMLKELYNTYPILSIPNKLDNMWSNQHYWHFVYLHYKSGYIKLDAHCQIFYNTSSAIDQLRDIDFSNKHDPKIEGLYLNELNRLRSALYLKNGRLTCHQPLSSPCHLHFPGPVSKMIMQDFFFSNLMPAS